MTMVEFAILSLSWFLARCDYLFTDVVLAHMSGALAGVAATIATLRSL